MSNSTRRVLLFLAGSLFFHLTARADISGNVTLQGTPNSKDETFVAGAKGCGEGRVRHTENWKIGPKGELADVVVWIVEPKFSAKPPPAAEPEVRQIGCRYDPHVIAVVAGAPFRVLNGDPTLHNVLAREFKGADQPPGATAFNLGQSYQGQVDERTFSDPGIFILQCNVHSWMQSWVKVLPHGVFAVTGADGTFQIAGTLLDGDYKIDAWHPRFAAPLEQTVHVKNGGAKAVFQFEGSKSL